VFFAKGQPRDFDLVIAADGIRSRTRTLVFGNEAEIRELGLYLAYFTIPRTASDSAWWRWYNAPRRRVISLRPDNVGTTRALLSFISEPHTYESLSVEEQKNLFRNVFADAGWEAPRILSALEDSADFYFESIGRVYAPRWSRGRVALVGDAGYCPSPISGMGTSLAFVGSYVLAGEIAKHENYREAFASYERILRPYVQRAQQLLPGAPGLAHPKTKIGIAILHGCTRLAESIQASGIANKLFTSPAEKFELPDY
jgi:2-polyprenyl-6-methoxyphenol hydroxylase-like FAD-dependent oxidoreductase